MIVPICCFTCGKVIADKYDYYKNEVQKLESKPEDTKQRDNESYKHFDKLKTGEILDKLQLKRYCCRRMMLTTVDMMDLI